MLNFYLFVVTVVFIFFATVYNIYCEKTKFKKYIYVKKKYTIYKNGNPRFLIMCADNHKYSISTSIFNLVGKNKEIFDSLDEGEMYSVEGCGLYIKTMSWYPTIYKLNLH